MYSIHIYSVGSLAISPSRYCINITQITIFITIFQHIVAVQAIHSNVYECVCARCLRDMIKENILYIITVVGEQTLGGINIYREKPTKSHKKAVLFVYLILRCVILPLFLSLSVSIFLVRTKETLLRWHLFFFYFQSSYQRRIKKSNEKKLI